MNSAIGLFLRLYGRQLLALGIYITSFNVFSIDYAMYTPSDIGEALAELNSDSSCGFYNEFGNYVFYRKFEILSNGNILATHFEYQGSSGRLVRYGHYGKYFNMRTIKLDQNYGRTIDIGCISGGTEGCVSRSAIFVPSCRSNEEICDREYILSKLSQKRLPFYGKWEEFTKLEFCSERSASKALKLLQVVQNSIVRQVKLERDLALEQRYLNQPLLLNMAKPPSWSEQPSSRDPASGRVIKF